MFAWWCAAGALTVLSAVLYRREIGILSAANPAEPLSWICRPANRPLSARMLEFVALLASALAVDSVFEALGRHPNDILWGLPALLTVLVMLVPQVQHNRRVRSAESPTG